MAGLLTVGTFRSQPSPAGLLVSRVGQYPKMAAAGGGGPGALAGLGQHAGGGCRCRRTAVLAPEIVKSIDRRTGSDRIVTFAHRLGQRDQIVLVGVGGQRARVPHEVPATWRGDPAGVTDAQVPGVRVA